MNKTPYRAKHNCLLDISTSASWQLLDEFMHLSSKCFIPEDRNSIPYPTLRERISKNKYNIVEPKKKDLS